MQVFSLQILKNLLNNCSKICIYAIFVVPLRAFLTKMRKSGLIILLSIAALASLLTGCGDYQKLLKSRDPEEKYQAALRYFNEQQYGKSQTLLDDVANYYKGTERAEDGVA